MPSLPSAFKAAAHDRLRGLGGLVGNTPMLAIDVRFRGVVRTIYAKAEFLNLTGSIKDRMALHMVRRAYEKGALHPGGTIVEATSGNTGIALAAVGRALGHPVTIFMPDWLSEERKNLMRSLGAELRLVSREAGGFLACLAGARALAHAQPGAWLADQFSNEDNVAAHQATTGPEIWAQLERAGVKPDAFVAGTGTGGTVMGVGRALKARNKRIKVHAVEPASSPTLSTGYKVGTHRIQGISDDFVPDILNLDQLDEVLQVDDGDAIVMAQMLARTLGLAVGISSGANFLAALLAAERIGDTATAVTVFADDNKKYLSTALMGDEPVKPGFLTPHVELLGLQTLPRAFASDWNPVDVEQPLVAGPPLRIW